MAFSVTTAPLYSTTGSYTANADRLMVQMNAGSSEGVRYAPTATTGDLAVTSTGAFGTVSLAAGHCVVAGAASSGFWYVYNDSATTLTVTSNASGNPRIDVVIITVNDALGTVTASVLAGTPAASPVAPTLTKSGSGASNMIGLAQIAVPNGYNSATTAVSAGWITDVRPRAYVPSASVPAATAAGFTTAVPSPQQGQLISDTNNVLREYTGANWYPASAAITCTSTTRPVAVPTGQIINETDTGLTRIYDGTNWPVLWASSSYTGYAGYTVSFTTNNGPTSPTVNYSRWTYNYQGNGIGKLFLTWQVTTSTTTWGSGAQTIFNLPLWNPTTAFAPITTGLSASASVIGTGMYVTGIFAGYPLTVTYQSAASGATPATGMVYAPTSSSVNTLVRLNATNPVTAAANLTISVSCEVPVTAVY